MKEYEHLKEHTIINLVIYITMYVCIAAYRYFLGGDLEANNGKAAVAVQRRGKHVYTTTELLLDKHVPEATFTHAAGETGCCLRDSR
jgi:hypothetical protein